MTFNILEKEYNVIINKKKIKNAYIKIDDDLNIVINVNLRASDKKVLKILEENISSIKRMIEKKKIHLLKEDKCFFLGEEYDLIKNNSFFQIDFETKKIYFKNKLEIEKFFEKETKKILSERYEKIYLEKFSKYKKPILKFRKMKTRWGVCNRKSKTITLNKELIKRTLSEIDYVIIHEFCHLEVFDHSKRFWDLVSFYLPEYKKIRKVLKD